MRCTLKLVYIIGITVVPAAFGQGAPVVSMHTNASASQPSDKERLDRLESAVQNMADLHTQKDNLISGLYAENSTLRGRVDELTHDKETAERRQRDLAQRLERLESIVASNPGILANAPATTVPPQLEPKPSPLVSEQGAKDAYEAALNLVLKEKDYPRARGALELFVQTHTQSSFTPNAYYWLGQLYLNNQDSSKAQQAFQTVVDKYPDSNKRPDALLKLGIIAENHGQIQLATTYFKQLIQESPGSASAKIAQKTLAQQDPVPSSEQNIDKQTK